MWYQAYTQLIDFISKHEEIKICENTVRIPQEHRAQFYELFDNVRKTFMTERLSGMLGEAKLLSENYVKLEDEVVNLLKTKKVSMSVFPTMKRSETIRGTLLYISLASSSTSLGCNPFFT